MRLKYLFLAFCARALLHVDKWRVLLIFFNNIIHTYSCKCDGVRFNIIFIAVHAIVLLLCVYIYTLLRVFTLGGGFSGTAPPRCVGKPNRSSSGIARS